MLIDREIRAALEAGDIVIYPDDGLDTRIQPASIDVRLGHEFLTYDRNSSYVIDPKVDQTRQWHHHARVDSAPFVLNPGELILASTYEDIALADTILARVEGKSSLGRLGILVHATAGYIDPGWPLAKITLELSTQMGVPTVLYPEMPIAQLAFERVSQVAVPYGGKYAGQDGPQPSRYHLNWTGSRWS